MDSRTLLGVYFRQQDELVMPDVVVEPEIINLLLKPSVPRPRVAAVSPPSPPQFRPSEQAPRPAARQTAPAVPSVNTNFKSRLSSLRPVEQLMASAPRPSPRPVAQVQNAVPAEAAVSGKRAALKEVYLAGCTACRLAEHRAKLVFGSGNADASIMVVGDVPAFAESESGVPFGGEAGGLLTSMLAAIGLDRANDIFLTNVLKCPPPGGRGADDAEIAACLPMLKKQIAIIQPKALLLLGRIAANTVLGVRDEIAAVRSKTLDYGGIPAMVTEHPSELLRTPALKRAAWGDLQQFSKLLSSLGIYGSLDKK